MAGRRWLFAAAGLALVAVAGPIAGLHTDGSATVDCTDPRGCPDLAVLDRATPFLQNLTFEEDDCAVQEGHVASGERRLLRFNTTTGNWGAGDLVVGAPRNHPQWYTEARCHDHYHFEGFAAYRLWTPSGFQEWNDLRRDNPDVPAADLMAAHPDLEDAVVTARKQGFCIFDSHVVEENLSRGEAPKYRTCRFQGISTGHGDTYGYPTTGQWIDVTDVPNGTYVLEKAVNPERIIVEEGYRNDRHWRTVELGPPLHEEPFFDCTTLVFFDFCRS